MSLIQPALNDTPFAKNGQKNTIPKTTSTKGKASLDQGFPPETMVDKLSGGIAPSGKDMNGILALLSEHQIWLNAGGMYKFNGELANAIGGYAKGALVLSDNENEVYFSTVSNNGNNPNVNLTGWKYLSTYDDVEYLATQIQSLLNNKYDKSGGQISGDVVITGQTYVHPLWVQSSNNAANVCISLDSTNYNVLFQSSGPTGGNYIFDKKVSASDLDIRNGQIAVLNSSNILVASITNAGLVTGKNGNFQEHLGLGQFFSGDNGYSSLPNGMIIQWGISAGGDYTHVNFPITFPNKLFSVQVSDRDGRESHGYDDYSTSGFNVRTTAGTLNFGWIAIGN
ncbi:gp53-like domain-containing protein [Acinetobacter guerrae]|uniref:gp53-like domain-containing protein n=1 Tax=Acinetobacter guerrae TaxID=1843371 RepID=UPI00128DEDC7|nr:hypothetical protein [Acinetobacter guerrae]MPW44733.1 hypothetical protein [Acinetobacter guerrae]